MIPAALTNSDELYPIGNDNKILSKCNVHFLDLTNHGKSYSSKSHTLFEYGIDILNYIYHHNLKNVFIFGHSLGGRVAMVSSFT